MLDAEVLESYRTAGEIAAEIRKEAEKIVRKGVPLQKICAKHWKGKY